MTNREAIKRIKDHMEVHKIGEYPHIKLAEAINMAIDALNGQQAHVKFDRSRWDGCDYCKISCGNCVYSNLDITKEPCKSCKMELGDSFTIGHAGIYCRECGRPLTEEAWTELERRVNGGTVD